MALTKKIKKIMIKTLCTRAGNKEKFFDMLYSHFPQTKINTFVDLFFGAGGATFGMNEKKEIKYIIANDLNNDVFNLWQVVTTNKNELVNELQKIPNSEQVFYWFKKNIPTCNIKRAARFIFLSNFGFLGKFDTFKIDRANTMEVVLKKLDEYNYNQFKKIKFLNRDFKDVLNNIHNRHEDEKKTFIYADPPYYATSQDYDVGGAFGINNFKKLLLMCKNSPSPFAISEFDHSKIIKLASKADLNLKFIINRQNMKDRRNEILITNY